MNIRRATALILTLMSLSTGALSAEVTKEKPAFDPQLAKELGADEYGMHKYVMALLKAGPHRDQDPGTAAELQRAHMANIQRLADEGVLVLAGPFLDGVELRGIYVFDVDTVEEAQKLTETDPAVQAGRLVMELHPWYGSAALKKINQLHGTLAKQSP
ncbi:YciI family protein [Microbulbifer pacificus]|uniref:YciI family protein n=1 Tax=Microbulbifer pacificus TaxID=407164 RepID=UPI000CF39749|nr:YciI family protein [Microbulbifer pacificus]